ncbi:MAG TPA: DUF456 domain-containing protein [Anaeromyxobacteraceae bacterium]|nr:DUF456 domain-containing protein [Anaeromyxobacteraceae bacterium]
MSALLYVLGALALAAGVAGLVLPVLPGALLLVAGVSLIAWAGHFHVVGPFTIAFAAGVGLLITAVDLLAGVLGAKAFGASKWAVVGSSVGLVVGLFLGLPGILLGPPVGAMAFELGKNPDVRRAAKAGVGAFVGFAVGSVLKIALAFALLGVLAAAFVLR